MMSEQDRNTHTHTETVIMSFVFSFCPANLLTRILVGSKLKQKTFIQVLCSGNEPEMTRLAQGTHPIH